MKKNHVYTTTRLTESFWPADTSRELLESTVGDVLRQVAAEVPNRLALVEGVPDPAKRRRWTLRPTAQRMRNGSPQPCSTGLSPGTEWRCGRTTSPNGFCWNTAAPLRELCWLRLTRPTGSESSSIF